MKPFLVLPIAALACLSSCDKLRKMTHASSAPAKPFAGGLVSEITPDTFDEFHRQPGRVIIIDFHADWCGPCREMGPVLDEIAEEKNGLVLVGKVNVDQAKPLAVSEGVRGIPDVRIYRDGEQVDRLVGFPGKAEVRRRVEKQLQGLPPLPPEAAAPTKPAASTPQPMSKDWLPAGMKRR